MLRHTRRRVVAAAIGGTLACVPGLCSALGQSASVEFVLPSSYFLDETRDPIDPPAWVRVILDRAGLSGKLWVLPYRRIYSPAIQSGAYFSWLPTSLNGTAARGFVPLAKLYDVQVYAFARKGVPLRSEADLASIGLIGLVRGEPPDLGYHLDPAWHVQRVSSPLAGLRMLAAGRLDAIIEGTLSIDIATTVLHLDGVLGDRVKLYDDEVDLVATASAAGTPEAEKLTRAARDVVDTLPFERMLRDETSRFFMAQELQH